MRAIVAAEDPKPAAGQGWRWFLGIWTIVVIAVVLLLWCFGRLGPEEQVFVLNDGATESFWMIARRSLWLAHLSLSRGYPWVLLAPYVVWAASRFSLDREHLRRHLLLQITLAALFVVTCQFLNGRLVSGRPVRMIVAVTETSSSGTNGLGEVGETVRRLRKEMRISTLELSGAPPPEGAILRGIETNLNHSGDPMDFKPEEGFASWTHGSPGFPDHGFRIGWFRRTRVASVALDFAVFVSICGLGHAVHFRRRFQERERRAVALESSLARARLHTLQAQLQPHFLFNTLNSITALVRQNPAAAEEMLTSLSDLLRLALSSATRPWSSLREELRFLQIYLDIQQTRFGDRLRFAQEIEPATLDCAIPSLLLQPLVENAIRHGIEPTNRQGTVRVRAQLQGEALELSVEDDGMGCPALLDGSARLGVGLTNVRERIEAMFGSTASLTFASAGGTGLAVRIRLPARGVGEEI